MPEYRPTVSGMDTHPQTLLSVAQVCARLGCSRTTLWSLRRSGRFPSGIQIGAQLRWRVATVDAWLDGGGSVAA